jgi:LuxR family transcriptional regulator, maltose regulon positive regulatory protein
VVTTPLLETKLHPPRRRRELVARSRLSERLRRGRDVAVTVVAAPAGFGKTTLLSEWLGDAPRTAWLSLDGRDNDPTRFWSYVVAALRTVAPGIGETALSLLGSSPAAVEAALVTLVNELAAAEDDLVLVLDDYHAIESVDLHEAMAFLVEHLPPQVHLVVASRADPPLPLARLRARGQLLEVRAADLRFTVEEAAAYFNGSMGLDLSADDVTALEARAEGWIAALQLAALSMQGRDDVAEFIANFTGDDRFVVDYLVEEVLERQPVEVRRFLVETAVLGRLTGSLCDAVTGGTGGRARLEMLERANLFVVPLDDRRLWYRYHHLFADVLRARLLDEQPDRVPELHRRASAWHAENGDRAEAIAHAMAGGHFERAAELVELTAPLMRRTRQEATLRRWLEALPEHLLEDRPVLAIALVGARMATGDGTGVESLLRSVESWLHAPAAGTTHRASAPIVFDAEELARLPAQVAVYRAALALLAGDVAGTIAHADRVLSLVEPSDHFLRGSASGLLGLAHWTVADLDTARDRYADAVRAFVDAGHLPDVLGCSLALADIQMAQGRLGDAAHTFEAGLRLTQDHPGLRGRADMHVGLCEVLLERDEVEAAARHLDAADELGEHAGLPQHRYRRRVAAARLRQVEGDARGALALLAEAERVYETDFSPAVRPIPALVARAHLTLGDLAAADRWAHDHHVAAGDELTYVREFEHITLARLLIARRDSGAVGDALHLVDRLLAAAEHGRRGRSAVELLVLRSLAHDALGDRHAAAAALEEALARAEPEGYVRVFADEAPTLTALLHAVPARGAAGRHARRVLASTSPSGGGRPSGRELVKELSGRERDVLRLLRSELSGPDIARELVVSLNTVRTHTKNIYAKLGVTSRRQAVRRAEELGL